MSIEGKVTILGANGAIGRGLGPLLGQHGIPYRVVGRSLLALQVRFHGDPLCEQLQWDPEDKDAFELACAGAGTVVYLVGVALWKFKDHLPLIQKTLLAAKQAGVQRFLLVSSNWSYGTPQTEPVGESHPREPATVKGRIRREQEDRVLAAHVPGIFATGVLRMADLYGPRIEASHVWSVFQAAKKGTEAQVLGPIDRPHEFVYVPDAVATIPKILETDAAWSGEVAQTWNLGGVAVTTIREMAELVFATEGKPPKYNVPGKFMMGFVRALNPYIRELGEMQHLLDQPLLLDDAKLAQLLGGLHKTPYAEGVRATLALR
jgi:nucleoside-diphosphate-sugar epimerase